MDLDSPLVYHEGPLVGNSVRGSIQDCSTESDNTTKDKHDHDDLHHSARLEAFCDAVLAIIATILMLPLGFTDEEMQQNSLSQLLLKSHHGFILHIPHVPHILINFAFFIFAFALIVTAWQRNVRIFSFYPKTDFLILWMNILFLLGCSFLPLVTSFLNIGPYPTVIAMLLACTLLIGITQTVHICSGFIRPNKRTGKLGITVIVFQILSYFILPFILFILLGISYIEDTGPYIAGISLLAILIISKTLNFFLKYCTKMSRTKFISCFSTLFSLHKPRNIGDITVSNIEDSALRSVNFDAVDRRNNVLIFDKFLNKLENFNSVIFEKMHRIEFFSDGVFAIVATIVILEATNDLSMEILNGQAKDRTTDEWFSNDGVNHVLYEEMYLILSYLLCFLFVCVFWYLHHSILSYFKRIDSISLSLNMTMLLFVCLIPFCASILKAYARKSGENLSLAMLITCIVIYVISMLQLWLWMYLVFWFRTRPKNQTDDAQSKGPLKQPIELLDFAQMGIRLFVIPTFSFTFIFIDALTPYIVFPFSYMFGSFLFLFIFQMLTEVPCLMNKYIFSKKINIAV